MKKIKLMACIAVSMLILSACSSGVSRDDYDNLSSEKERIATEYSDLKKEYDNLKKEYDELNDKYFAELDAATENLVDEIPLDFALAWVHTSFGDSASCSLDENHYLTVNVPTPYTADNAAAATLTDFENALKTWVYIDSPTGETSSYKYVIVNFYDNNQNGLLSYFFDNSNKKMELKTVMGDMANAEKLVSSFQSR